MGEQPGFGKNFGRPQASSAAPLQLGFIPVCGVGGLSVTGSAFRGSSEKLPCTRCKNHCLDINELKRALRETDKTNTCP